MQYLRSTKRLRGARSAIVVALSFLISNGQNAPGNRNSYDRTMEALQQRDITRLSRIAQGTSLVYLQTQHFDPICQPDGRGCLLSGMKNSGTLLRTCQKITQMARNKYVRSASPPRRC